MTWRLSCLAVILIASTTAASTTPAVAGNSVLIATPSQGHSGDTIFLAGTGFRPDHRIIFQMYCPNWIDRNATLYQNYTQKKEGPITDAHGEFKGFKIQVPPLHNYLSSACQIYDTNGENPFGPDIPASFFILAPDQRASVWERSIVLSVRAQPTRVHTGLFEHISVQSVRERWPGAEGLISIQYPHIPAVQRTVTLNVNGFAALKIQAPVRTTQPVEAHVLVRVHLGNYTGRGNSQFTVVQ